MLANEIAAYLKTQVTRSIASASDEERFVGLDETVGRSEDSGPYKRQERLHRPVLKPAR